MTSGPELSVLVTCRGPEAVPGPDAATLDQIVQRLPGSDKWAQYPDASGRGHAIEFRFWIDADDGIDAAARATEIVVNELGSAGLSGWEPERVHVATAAERVVETTSGVADRLARTDEWSVQIRVIASSIRVVNDPSFAGLVKQRFGTDDCDVLGSGNHLEFRVWQKAVNAVSAAERAVADVLSVLQSVDDSDWTVVRVHAASPNERDRERYRGVYERLILDRPSDPR